MFPSCDASIKVNDAFDATHLNTLQHTATHCNTLQHTATHCNTLQHTETFCNTLQQCKFCCTSDGCLTQTGSVIPRAGNRRKRLHFSRPYSQVTEIMSEFSCFVLQRVAMCCSDFFFQQSHFSRPCSQLEKTRSGFCCIRTASYS